MPVVEGCKVFSLLKRLTLLVTKLPQSSLYYHEKNINLLFMYVMDNRIRIILFNMSEDYKLYYSKCTVYPWVLSCRMNTCIKEI
jgi:hypothetical protein